MSETATENPTTENPNGENGDNATPETPEYVMPTAETVNFGENLITGLSVELLKEIQKLKEIDALLDRQKSDYAETRLIDFAENSDDPEIKSAYGVYAKQVERLKKLTEDLVKKVSEKLGDEKLSEDEIDAKKETRKSIIETVKSSLTVISSFVDQGMAGDNTDAAKEFIEHVKIPGTRASSGGSTGSGSGTPKPRLNGGSITIGNQNHKNFPAAARDVSNKLGKEVSTPELINAWVDSQNVSDWKDIPEVSTFKYENVEISIVKYAKKQKDEPAESAA